MTKEAEFERIICKLRRGFDSGKTKSHSFRVSQLKKFVTMMEESQADILLAMSRDLRKHKFETILFEIEGVIAEAKFFIKNLKEFMAPEVLPFNILAAIDTGKIDKVPYGLVLILGAWNYPFHLSFLPFLGAIAAGNAVILKPSEVGPHTSALMARLIPKYLDSEVYSVIEGGPGDTQLLLKYKFDKIFYTGSTNVGRLVMQAAALHLTPVTLELGGKSPVYVDDNADYEIACKRILWGRFANAGQTCIAPDYILCSEKVEKEIVRVGKQLIYDWYDSNPQKSESFSRIINAKHVNRLKQLLEATKGTIVVGGKVDVDDLYVEPTIVVGVSPEDPLMQEEIFGPILPIVRVNSMQEAADFINARPRPLAMYSFSKDAKVNNQLKDQTISGGVCFNDVIWHCVWNGLAFGGVGNSGMGNYHGKHSFETFSHKRSVLERSFSALSEKLGESRYPPYSDSKLKMMTFIVRHFLKFNVQAHPVITHFLALLIGAVICAAVYHFAMQKL